MKTKDELPSSSKTIRRTPDGPNGNSESSLSDEVYKILLQRLLNNELVPGEMLNRRDVAKELGVSVAPVLEAMLQLEMAGFLEGMPRKGTRVRPIRKEDLRGQLIVREALECAAARLYCGERLRKAASDFARLARDLDGFSTDTPERWQEEIEFHRGLVSLTGVDLLVREFERNMQLNIFFRINRVLKSSDQKTKNSHVVLLRELQAAEPDRAERLIRNHIRQSKEYLFE